jgi:hypothetical protein
LHPIIQLACFIILLIGLTVATPMIIIIGLPLFFWLVNLYGNLATALTLLKRLRWLLLSLLILNLWFHSAEFTWIPSLAGIDLALLRVAILIILVLAAHLLVTVTSTANLIAAIQWWLQPLTWLGLATDRLAIRLILVIDTIQMVQQFYTTPTTNSDTNSNSIIDHISNQATQLFLQVFQHAESAPLRTLAIPILLPPPLWQWSYPLLLALLILLTK